MILLDRMLVGVIKFDFDTLATAVDSELNDDTALREELLAAQMKVELGEMSQEEVTELEDRVLTRIREIREARGQPMGAIEFGGGGSSEEGSQSWSGADIAGITADFVADDFHEPEEAEAPALPEPNVVVEAAVAEPKTKRAPKGRNKVAPRKRKRP